MDRKEYDALLDVIEQTIETSVSSGGGAFPGNRREPHSHGPGRLKKAAKTQYRLYDGSDVDSGDPHLDAIGRLYRNCCKGLKSGGTS